MPKIGIYKITNPTGKVYIGQSRDLTERRGAYKRLECRGQYRIYNSIKKYGWKNHSFEIIEECATEDLNKRERYWQDFYDVLNKEKGLNLTLVDTDEAPRVLSDETREKMRESGKVKIFTEEHRANLAKVWLGRKHTPETIERMKNYYKENPHPNIGKIPYNKGKTQPQTAGGLNPAAKLIVCEQTGIFYYHRKEACEAFNINYSRLGHMLRGTTPNITTLVYA